MLNFFKKNYFLLISIVFAIILIKGNFIETHKLNPTPSETLNGIVLETIETDEGLNIEVLLENKKTIEIPYTATLTSPQNYQEKDKIIVMKSENEEYFIVDYQRNSSLLIIFILFVLVLLLTSSKEGLFALIAMGISFIILFKFTLPLIINGQDPVGVTLLSSFLIIPITFYISHGIKKKTHIAAFSTIITLIFTSILAYYFLNLSNITGLADENYIYLSEEVKKFLDLKGLVLAGVIISILGVLDDVTIAQASIVEELHEANKKLKFKELFSKAMKVGKDHISSMVNTLVLVYAGASLPLLLVFLDYSEKFFDVINYEFIATEIIQTLIGSIGLILAIPITTFLSTKAYLYKAKN